MINKIKRALFGEPREYRCVAEEYQFWHQIASDYRYLAKAYLQVGDYTLTEYYSALMFCALSKRADCRRIVVIAWALCIREATK